MPVPVEVKLLIGAAGDVDAIARHVCTALESDWMHDRDVTGVLRPKTTYWRRDLPLPYHREGGQGSINDMARMTAGTYAIFDKAGGTEWTDAAGHTYPSGTSAEVELAVKEGRHVRVFISASLPGEKVWYGPDDRSPELRKTLRRWVEEGIERPEGMVMLLPEDNDQKTTGTNQKLILSTWTTPESLTDAVLSALTQDISHGYIKVSRLGLPEQIRIGIPGTVGGDYQDRDIDTQVAEAWDKRSFGGSNLVWLWGPPGLGKSYLARKVVNDAVTARGFDKDDVVIWVDSANTQIMIQRLADAAKSLPQLGIPPNGDDPNPEMTLAKEFLDKMSGSQWRWLVVLDNADIDDLRSSGLMPPDKNPYGRILVTSIAHHDDMFHRGTPVKADLFTEEQVRSFVKAQKDRSGGSARITKERDADIDELGRSVGRHPLALSVATATIVTYSLSISAWISEFQEAEHLDDAVRPIGDAGYFTREGDDMPRSLSAIWQVALRHASQGRPNGEVEKCAIVAALLDPDGHPTWIWDDPDIQDWITGGGPLERLFGIPLSVESLWRNGVLSPKDEEWASESILMHQLAGRVVLEHSDPELCGSIGNLLVNALYFHDTSTTILADEAVTIARNAKSVLEKASSLDQRYQAIALDLAERAEATTQGPQAALPVYQQSLDLRQHLADRNPGSLEAQRDLTVSLNNVAQMLATTQGPQAALSVYQQSLDITQHLADLNPGSLEAQRDLTVSLNNVAQMLATTQGPQAALSVYQQSLDITQHLADLNPGSLEAQRDLTVSLNNVAQMLATTQGPQAALSVYQQSLDITQHLADLNPGSLEAQRDLTVSLNNVAQMLATTQGPQAALPVYQQSLDITQHLADLNPGSLEAQRDLTVSLNNVAQMLATTQGPQAALSVYQQSLDITQHLADLNPGSLEAQRDLTVSLDNVAKMLATTQGPQAALPLWEHALDISRGLACRQEGNLQAQEDLTYFLRPNHQHAS